jgi:Nucleotidyl transferase AbiEii toxin, Type IV TA system
MLRTQTVEERILDLIKRFMSDDKFNNFNLVGGTALALKIGRRVSVDIDLFSTTPFDAVELGQHLGAAYNATDIRTLTNGVFCFVDDIKIDLLSRQYPLVENIDILEGIRIVSLPDIGAMKLNAIFNSGNIA